ncbi:hypothetical protein B0H10DRAFT_2236088 [Mycena sp. CBHHK59/15]|nr:hypothetical protein B0H10DRAFT_2236088 [Mycena sp. CBHHK59/15]
MPVEALDMIHENVKWLTPVAMVTKVQAAFPSVKAAQIHRAWMEESKPFWCFDNDQLLSTKKLLEEHTDDIDIFEPTDIPEGVEMVCWGMKKIAMPLKGKIVEVGVDATYNTNSKHLELYSIMGEQEGAGFPLSYLLLSTAFSIDQGKRTKALTAWAKCVRDTYSIIAKFTHVDKDMAEIGMLLDIWNAKISLCWWHLRRAVRTRLASAKLATTPYDPGRTHAEFSFIDVAFVPAGKADAAEYKGGVPDIVSPVPINLLHQSESTECHKQHRETRESEREQRPKHPRSLVVSGRTTKPTWNTDAADSQTLARAMNQRVPAAVVPKATQKKPKPAADVVSGSESEEEDGKGRGPRRTFCPISYREPILTMMEKHYFTQMYKFCVEHELREVWAYLWENWYRSSCLELWARSVHLEIPVLKTTMILESHWRRIKHDFLHHFHMPRFDLLAWILIVKLAPTFYRKLEWLLTDTGRYRELPSWRKDFKRVWKKLESTPITIPMNPAYKMDTKKMLCTCPSLPTSRFLLCKHVVQGVEPVPPVFFLEVKRRRTAPFWSSGNVRGELQAADMAADWDDMAADWDDNDDDLVDTQAEGDWRTFTEAMDEDINLILSPAPSTWDKSTGSAMFYRASEQDGTLDFIFDYTFPTHRTYDSF